MPWPFLLVLWSFPCRIWTNVVQITGFTLFTWAVQKLHADISSKHNFCYSAFNEMKRKTETTKLSSLQKKVPTFYVSKLLKWKPSRGVSSKHSVWSQGKLCVSEQLPQQSATWESSGSYWEKLRTEVHPPISCPMANGSVLPEDTHWFPWDFSKQHSEGTNSSSQVAVAVTTFCPESRKPEFISCCLQRGHQPIVAQCPKHGTERFPSVEMMAMKESSKKYLW